MFDTIMKGAWELLAPNLGAVALVCVGIGIIVGLVRKAIDKLGTTPVMLTLGGIVIVAWAVRYVTAPPKIVEVPKPVEVRVPVERIVEKVVVDTRAADALKKQLQAEQQVKKGLLESLFKWESKAAADKAERDRVEQAAADKKAGFEKTYREAQSRPVYQFENRERDHHKRCRFAVLRHDTRDGYLATSVYECYLDPNTHEAIAERVLLSVQDKNMHQIGKAQTVFDKGYIYLGITFNDDSVDWEYLAQYVSTPGGRERMDNSATLDAHFRDLASKQLITFDD